MTTIVYKYPFLVADQRLADERSILGTSEKVFKLETRLGYVYTAYCGDAGLDNLISAVVIAIINEDQEVVVKSLKTIKDVISEKVTVGGVVVFVPKVFYPARTPTPVTYRVEPDFFLTKFTAEFRTDGSGGDVATGALGAGCSVWKALDIASKHDLFTGYPFSGYNVLTGEYTIHAHPKSGWE